MPHMIPAPGAFAAGVAIFLIVLWDAFEAIILPRRVTRRFRLTRLFYKNNMVEVEIRDLPDSSRKTRETLLGLFWPALASRARRRLGRGTGVRFRADAIRRGLRRGHDAAASPAFRRTSISAARHFSLWGSATSIPHSGCRASLVVIEAGFGFGFLAAVIGYLPFIYGSFSKREVNISLLDSRAGTPPTAGELLRRHSLLAMARTLSRTSLKIGSFGARNSWRAIFRIRCWPIFVRNTTTNPGSLRSRRFWTLVRLS